MMLKNKAQAIYRARCAVGGVIARTFVSEGAKLLLWLLLAIISWNCSHETLHDRRQVPTLAELAFPGPTGKDIRHTARSYVPPRETAPQGRDC